MTDRRTVTTVTFPERSARTVGFRGENTADVTGGLRGRRRGAAGLVRGRRAAVRAGAPEPERRRRLGAGVGVGRVRGGRVGAGISPSRQPARLDHARRRLLLRPERGRQLLHGGRLRAQARRPSAGRGGAARPARLGARDRAARPARPAVPRRPAALVALAVAGGRLRGGGRAVDGRHCRAHGARPGRSPHPGGLRREPAAAQRPRPRRRLVERAPETCSSRCSSPAGWPRSPARRSASGARQGNAASS